MDQGEHLYSRRPAANSRNIGVEVSLYFLEMSRTRLNFLWISDFVRKMSAPTDS